MIKKIVISIILIMSISSAYALGKNIIESNGSDNSSSQESIKPSDSSTNSDSNNKEETDTTTDSENNKENNNQTNADKDDDISEETNKENNNQTNADKDNDKNEETNKENNDKNNSQTGNNENKPNTNKPQKPVTEPIQNNQSNNDKITKSSEARLKELKVDIEGLTPEFNKNTTEYYLVLDLSVHKINIKASTVDNKAKWAVYGNKNLKEGENTVTIGVTAEDGTKKEYYIHVTKVDNIELANAELEKLNIEGFSLYPSFKSNIYSYNLNINQDVSNLDITAVPLNEKATVEVEGNESLQKGENIIKINVTAANGETIRTYKINTYISSDRVELEEEDKTPAIILVIILGVCIIALGISIVVKNRK